MFGVEGFPSRRDSMASSCDGAPPTLGGPARSRACLHEPLKGRNVMNRISCIACAAALVGYLGGCSSDHGKAATPEGPGTEMTEPTTTPSMPGPDSTDT